MKEILFRLFFIGMGSLSVYGRKPDRGMFHKEYDPSNVFARILRGKLPCKKVAETKHSLAFLNPRSKASVHVLVIPKRPYKAASYFFNQAPSEEILDFFHLLGRLPQLLGIQRTGYRLISNEGLGSKQKVSHFHFHCLANFAPSRFSFTRLVKSTG